MSRVLIIAEHHDGSLNPATAKCVNCASGIGADAIHVAVFATDGAAIASQAAEIQGVDQVVLLDDAAFENPLATMIAPEAAAMAADYSHVLGPSTTYGKDLMPRIAALLGVNQVSDIMQVSGPNEFKRPIYAGNAIVDVRTPEGQPVVGTVRIASYSAAAGGNDATVESRAATTNKPAHTRYLELRKEGGNRPDLQAANVVISGGRALGSAENFEIIYALADKLGAAVGASRAAVDAGYVPNDLQVGQTGKIIAPDLYIAFGISGAIQHVTGIKDAGTIVAVNKDSEAPIFEIADIGLVGDLFKVIPELEAALG
jgi:electron transfer flavoprotein alpha subunit